MEITKTSENKVLVYELVYEESTIKELINEIITNCSIRVRRRHMVEAKSLEGAKDKINSFIDSIGNKIYKNVTDICEEKVNDPFDYWRHGDPVPYSFETDVLVSPKLVEFLDKLLSGEEISLCEYEYFKERKELSRKDKTLEEIERINSEIEQISNYDTERKIKKLQELAYMMERFKNIPNFNYETLSTYYDYADNCISLELVEETIKYKRMK